VSKSLLKEGDINVANLTKVKAVKNKMSPPYRLATFHVLYGQGIDRLGEIMDMASDMEIIKKWGKQITLLDNGAGGETKYTEQEFRQFLEEDPNFFYSVKNKIVEKIKNIELPVEETTEEV
jgi:recombination protein RecA